MWRLFLLLLFAGGVLYGMPALAQESGDVVVVTAEELPSAVASAAEGDTIEVNGGVLQGSLEIDKRLTISGINWPVIDGENQGTVVHISAPGVIFSGFVIKNSGSTCWIRKIQVSPWLHLMSP